MLMNCFDKDVIINELESILNDNDEIEASVVADVVQGETSENTERKKI